MTQAHKTPGAIVEIHDDLKPGGKLYKFYNWLDWNGKVFEVVKEEPCGHLHLKDAVTGEKVLGCWHDTNFKPVSEEKKSKKRH